MLERLLSDYDLEALGITSRSKAQKDRVAGRGIPFVKIGRLVRYRPADVETFLSQLPTLRSTSEAEASAAQARIELPAIPKESVSGPTGNGRRRRATRRERASQAMRTVPEPAHPDNVAAAPAKRRRRDQHD